MGPSVCQALAGRGGCVSTSKQWRPTRSSQPLIDARAWWGSSSEDEEVDFEEGKDTAVTSSTASVGSWGAWMDRGGLQEGAVMTC